MDDPLRHESPVDRIARAAERVNAATLRASQAQEALTAAEERLALAWLALEHARAEDPRGSALAGDPMEATDTS
jgi:hypothetical protein